MISRLDRRCRASVPGTGRARAERRQLDNPWEAAMNGTGTVDLVQLAQHRALDELEEAWLTQAEGLGEADVAPFLRAVDVLASQKELDLCQTLLGLLIPGLREAGRWSELLSVLRRSVELGAPGDEFRDDLIRCLEETHADRAGFSAYLKLSGLDKRKKEPVSEALARLDTFLSFPKGQHVFHASGWGVGRVADVVRHTGDLLIDFEERSGHQIPIEGAVQFLERLAAEDIRSLIFSDVDGLKRLAVEDPAELLRCCVRSRGGSAAVSRIKLDLIGPVLTQKEWSKMWPRAKRALTHDAHAHISPGSRPVITLRQQAQTFADQVVEELKAAGGIAKAVKIGRRFLREVGARPDAVDAEGLAQVADTLRQGLSVLAGRLDGEEAGAAYEAVHVLRGLEELGAAHHELPQALSAPPATAEVLVRVAVGIRDAKTRESYLAEAASAHGSEWPALAAQAIEMAPKEVFVPLVGLLHDAAPGELVQALGRIANAADPNHEAFLALARELFSDRLAEIEGLPTRQHVLERLLALFDKYERRRSGPDGSVPNLRPQVRSLLEPNRYAVVRAYFQEAPKSAVKHTFDRIMGSHALDDEVREAARSVVARLHPELLAAAGGRFWEEDRVFATQKGIERQAERLRELKNEKMNEVAKAIGDAAAFGDLSENAEFTAALEERDRLVARIERMQEELEGATALEEVQMPEGVVCPGSRVELTNEDGGTEKYTILGPWDVDTSAGIISYTAPLAGGLLGHSVNEEVVLALPDGTRRRVRVKSIEGAL
jgi:transcription elongation GreA/GreB family factor